MRLTAEEMYDALFEYRIATEDELALISSINGHNTDTYEDVLYSRTGYRTFEQLLEMEFGEK